MARGRKTGGRQKGTPNKATCTVREGMEAAFSGIGGIIELTRWAKANPGDFYRLWARLLPVQVNAQVAGRLTLEQLVAGAEVPSP